MLRLLGEIDGKTHHFHTGLTLRLIRWFVELDQDMLATNSKRQKWKTPAIRAECRHSYKYVLCYVSIYETAPDCFCFTGGL